jgi:hypothetical protein
MYSLTFVLSILIKMFFYYLKEVMFIKSGRFPLPEPQ